MSDHSCLHKKFPRDIVELFWIASIRYVCDERICTFFIFAFSLMVWFLKEGIKVVCFHAIIIKVIPFTAEIDSDKFTLLSTIIKNIFLKLFLVYLVLICIF